MPKAPLEVYGDDLKDLRKSGLTNQTIQDAELRTEEDSAKLAKILRCSRESQCCRGGLVIPYRDLSGKVISFARVRPHHPATDRKGRLMKYMQAKGSSVRAYFPPASLSQLRNGHSSIYFAEGEKKALALSQLDLAVVGIGGVESWGAKGELIDDLAEISWTGRDVFIVFDYDEKPSTRDKVDSARRRLASALKKTGARTVFNVEIPPGDQA